MKKLLALLIAASVGFAAASMIVAQQQATRFAAQLAERQSAWQAEKAELETALKNAKGRKVIETITLPPQVVEVLKKTTPQESLDKLKSLKIAPGQSRSARQIIQQFENLIEAGPVALPVIRAFLARNEDRDYDPGANSGGKGQGPRDPRAITEFLVPPSLRLGLFDAAKHIGGTEAEKILAEALGTTGRGFEVAYLARVLQEMAPGKHRDLAVSVARDLLVNPVAKGAAPLDRFDPGYLYGVLSFFNDPTFVSQAQAQLVNAEGRVDRGALKYLQQTLGEQSVALAAQAWQDSRILSDQKEPLARVALAYVGANPLANELYQMAINDFNLPKDHRRELIEDLNTDGFPDKKNPTPRDLPLIQSRLEFIRQNHPSAIDQINAGAFAEAQKDLLKMLDRVNRPPTP